MRIIISAVLIGVSVLVFGQGDSGRLLVSAGYGTSEVFTDLSGSLSSPSVNQVFIYRVEETTGNQWHIDARYERLVSKHIFWSTGATYGQHDNQLVFGRSPFTPGSLGDVPVIRFDLPTQRFLATHLGLGFSAPLFDRLEFRVTMGAGLLYMQANEAQYSYLSYSVAQSEFIPSTSFMDNNPSSRMDLSSMIRGQLSYRLTQTGRFSMVVGFLNVATFSHTPRGDFQLGDDIFLISRSNYASNFWLGVGCDLIQ